MVLGQTDRVARHSQLIRNLLSWKPILAIELICQDGLETELRTQFFQTLPVDRVGPLLSPLVVQFIIIRKSGCDT